MLRIDYHLHSNLSSGGRSSLFALCRRAAALGFSAIAFTENADFDPANGAPLFPADDSYRHQIQRAREEFGEKLAITMGLEVSFQRRCRPSIARFLAEQNLDFVIGSVHSVDGKDVETDEFFAGRSEAQAYKIYFEELLEAVETGLFDAIGHLDLVKLRGAALYGPFDPDKHRPLLEPLLAEIIKRNIALEINSAGLRGPARETLPGPQTLRLYRALGGDAVTIGSDAHDVEELGFGIEQAAAVLRAEGFKSANLYKSRKPHPVPLA